MEKMKGIQKYITILILMALLLPVVSAINYPQLTGYVNDNANIITPEYREKISDLADRINKNTTVEIAILTIDNLEGDSIENYAVNTFRQNGVGKKDNNNGLLILVSKNDREYRFEVGYGLEGTIPDAMKVPIGDKIITPNFKNGDYGKGIYESMLVIEGLVTNNTDVLSKYGLSQTTGEGGSGGSSGGEGTILVLLLLGFGIVVLFLMIRESRGGTTIEQSPSLPTTYKQPPYILSRSSTEKKKRRSSYSTYSGSYGSSSSSHHSSGGGFGGGFGGFGGGRSGGGGFGGKW